MKVHYKPPHNALMTRISNEVARQRRRGYTPMLIELSTAEFDELNDDYMLTKVGDKFSIWFPEWEMHVPVKRRVD